MDNKRRILLVALLVFLAGSAVLLPAASYYDNTEDSTNKKLVEINNRRTEIEIEIAEVKPSCARLDVLRGERTALYHETNEVINDFQSAFSGERKAPKTTRKSLCYKHTAGEDQNQYVKIAAEISDNDLDFLSTLDAENGLWTPDRVHGDGVGHGFCGFSYPWHKPTIEDPRFKSDPKWQLEKCYKAYKGGTRFYGYDVRNSHKDNFTC